MKRFQPALQLCLNFLIIGLPLLASGQNQGARSYQNPTLSASDLVLTPAVANDPRCETILARLAQAAQFLNVTITDFDQKTFCPNQSNRNHLWVDQQFRSFVANRMRSKDPQWNHHSVSSVIIPQNLILNPNELNLNGLIPQLTQTSSCRSIVERMTSIGSGLGLTLRFPSSFCKNLRTDVAVQGHLELREWITQQAKAKYPQWSHPLAVGYVRNVPMKSAHDPELRNLMNMLNDATTLKGKTDDEYRQLIEQSFILQTFAGRFPKVMGCREHSIYVPSQMHTPVSRNLHEQSLQCLTPQEIESVRHYRNSGSDEMNRMLRTNTLDDNMRNQVEVLGRTLDKLVPLEGVSFRGVSQSQFFTSYQKGQIVNTTGFSSSSLDSHIARGFGPGVQMIMFSKTCPFILNVTDQAYGRRENEVLCKPNTRFEVVYREERERVLYLILEEVFPTLYL